MQVLKSIFSHIDCFFLKNLCVIPPHQKRVGVIGSEFLFLPVKNNLLKLLFVKRFENTFFCLEDFAFGTAPGIRKALPWGTGGNSIPGISFQGIIDIMTLETHIANHFL
jgi:hypothetical protein